MQIWSFGNVQTLGKQGKEFFEFGFLDVINYIRLQLVNEYYNKTNMYTLTEIALGSATVGEDSCSGLLRWDDVITGVLGELYRSGNIAKNS